MSVTKYLLTLCTHNNHIPTVYKKNVGEIFCLFKTTSDSISFLEYLNQQHRNIKFTVEHKIEGNLPFFVILIDKSQGNRPVTSIHRKETFTGLMTNYLSYIPLSYKLALVKTVIHTTFSTCNSWKKFHFDVKKTQIFITKESIPSKNNGS